MLRATSTLLGLGFALTFLFAGAHGASADIATPPGITIRETTYGPVFADATGRQLYVFDCDDERFGAGYKNRRNDNESSLDEICKRIRAPIANPGPSVCVGACTAEWPPFIAAADARDLGDWTTFKRDDGTRQWAYRGRPLYQYSRENLTYFVPIIPSSGNWHTALASWFFEQSAQKPPLSKPIALAAAPAGVEAREYPAEGPTLVDYRGMTLYVSASGRPPATPCKGDCEKGRVLAAPKASRSIGSWVVANKDTSPQWTYKGQALYLCSTDLKPGDMSCRGGYWQIAKP